jgi:hypothetical protein
VRHSSPHLELLSAERWPPSVGSKRRHRFPDRLEGSPGLSGHLEMDRALQRSGPEPVPKSAAQIGSLHSAVQYPRTGFPTKPGYLPPAERQSTLSAGSWRRQRHRATDIARLSLFASQRQRDHSHRWSNRPEAAGPCEPVCESQALDSAGSR